MVNQFLELIHINNTRKSSCGKDGITCPSITCLGGGGIPGEGTYPLERTWNQCNNDGMEMGYSYPTQKNGHGTSGIIMGWRYDTPCGQTDTPG